MKEKEYVLKKLHEIEQKIKETENKYVEDLLKAWDEGKSVNDVNLDFGDENQRDILWQKQDLKILSKTEDLIVIRKYFDFLDSYNNEKNPFKKEKLKYLINSCILEASLNVEKLDDEEKQHLGVLREINECIENFRKKQENQ